MRHEAFYAFFRASGSFYKVQVVALFLRLVVLCVVLTLALFLISFTSVRPEVCASVHYQVFTVAILAQGTNRGDALCAALLFNHIVSILLHHMF